VNELRKEVTALRRAIADLAESLTTLHAELALTRSALAECQARCYVGNQDQIAAKIKADLEAQILKGTG
jgi:sulfur transfer protein SufE